MCFMDIYKGWFDSEIPRPVSGLRTSNSVKFSNLKPPQLNKFFIIIKITMISEEYFPAVLRFLEACYVVF